MTYIPPYVTGGQGQGQGPQRNWLTQYGSPLVAQLQQLAMRHRQAQMLGRAMTPLDPTPQMLQGGGAGNYGGISYSSAFPQWMMQQQMDQSVGIAKHQATQAANNFRNDPSAHNAWAQGIADATASRNQYLNNPENSSQMLGGNTAYAPSGIGALYGGAPRRGGGMSGGGGGGGMSRATDVQQGIPQGGTDVAGGGISPQRPSAFVQGSELAMQQGRTPDYWQPQSSRTGNPGMVDPKAEPPAPPLYPPGREPQGPAYVDGQGNPVNYTPGKSMGPLGPDVFDDPTKYPLEAQTPQMDPRGTQSQSPYNAASGWNQYGDYQEQGPHWRAVQSADPKTPAEFEQAWNGAAQGPLAVGLGAQNDARQSARDASNMMDAQSSSQHMMQQLNPNATNSQDAYQSARYAQQLMSPEMGPMAMGLGRDNPFNQDMYQGQRTYDPQPFNISDGFQAGQTLGSWGADAMGGYQQGDYGGLFD